MDSDLAHRMNAADKKTGDALNYLDKLMRKPSLWNGTKKVADANEAWIKAREISDKLRAEYYGSSQAGGKRSKRKSAKKSTRLSKKKLIKKSRSASRKKSRKTSRKTSRKVLKKKNSKH